MQHLIRKTAVAVAVIAGTVIAGGTAAAAPATQATHATSCGGSNFTAYVEAPTTKRWIFLCNPGFSYPDGVGPFTRAFSFGVSGRIWLHQYAVDSTRGWAKCISPGAGFEWGYPYVTIGSPFQYPGSVQLTSNHAAC